MSAGKSSTLHPSAWEIGWPVEKAVRKQWTRDKRDGKEDADTLGRAAERVDDAVRSPSRTHITAAFSKAVPSQKLPRYFALVYKNASCRIITVIDTD